MKKLFLDDVRNPFDSSWDVVRDMEQFIKYITTEGVPDVIAFDHDLGPQHYTAYAQGSSEYQQGTGYDCARWLIQHCEQKGLKLPETIIVHSWNGDGARNIALAFYDFGFKRENILVFPYPCTPLKQLIELMKDTEGTVQ